MKKAQAFAAISVLVLAGLSAVAGENLLPDEFVQELCRKPNTGVGKVSYDTFVRNYQKNRQRDYVVLQGLAAMWSDAMFEDFKRIVELLEDEGWIFTTPAEYPKFRPYPSLPLHVSRSRFCYNWGYEKSIVCSVRFSSPRRHRAGSGFR